MAISSYLKQLLADIEASANRAATNIELNFNESQLLNKSADFSLSLCAVTHLSKEMLPPSHMLSEEEISMLLQSMKKLLAAYNCHFVLQMEVPEEIQYETIRQHLDQKIMYSKSQIGFFEWCSHDTTRSSCTLGDYCHCAFFEKFVVGGKSII